MTLAEAYVGYMLATTVFSIATAQAAKSRALLSGSTHYQVCLILAWYDFWIGSYYDRKLHRVYMFPVPMLGICVDFDPPPTGE